MGWQIHETSAFGCCQLSLGVFEMFVLVSFSLPRWVSLRCRWLVDNSTSGLCLNSLRRRLVCLGWLSHRLARPIGLSRLPFRRNAKHQLPSQKNSMITFWRTIERERFLKRNATNRISQIEWHFSNSFVVHSGRFWNSYQFRHLPRSARMRIATQRKQKMLIKFSECSANVCCSFELGCITFSARFNASMWNCVWIGLWEHFFSCVFRAIEQKWEKHATSTTEWHAVQWPCRVDIRSLHGNLIK